MTSKIKDLEAKVRQACKNHSWKVQFMRKVDLGADYERVDVYLPYGWCVNMLPDGKNTVKIELVSPMLEESHLTYHASILFAQKMYEVTSDSDCADITLHHVPFDEAYIENALRDTAVMSKKLAKIWNKYDIDLYINDLKKLKL